MLSVGLISRALLTVCILILLGKPAFACSIRHTLSLLETFRLSALLLFDLSTMLALLAALVSFFHKKWRKKAIISLLASVVCLTTAMSLPIQISPTPHVVCPSGMHPDYAEACGGCVSDAAEEAK